MKYVLIVIFLFFSVSLHAGDQKLETSILGYWKAVIANKEQYLKLGISEENLTKSAVEMRFSEDGVLFMRGFDPAYKETKKIKEYTGTYRIKGERIYFKLNLGADAEEDQKIEIINDVLILTPIQFDGKVSNKFKRIEGWTLQI